MANEELPKLLRAIAASERGQEQRHDIIFNAAAAEIERLRLALREAREATRAMTRIIETEGNH